MRQKENKKQTEFQIQTNFTPIIKLKVEWMSENLYTNAPRSKRFPFFFLS